MPKGAKYRVWIKPDLGYGADEKKDQTGKVVIPANSILVFDIDMLDFLPKAVIRQMQMQQQLMGGAGGPPPGGPYGLSAPPPCADRRAAEAKRRVAIGQRIGPTMPACSLGDIVHHTDTLWVRNNG